VLINVRPGSEEGSVARECSSRMSWRRGVASPASGSSAREIETAGRGPAVPASIQTRSLGTRHTPWVPLGRAPQSTLPMREQFSHHFFEGLSQVPGRTTESEQIQGASKMRPLPGSCPNSPHGDLERAGAVSSDFRDGAVELIVIPEVLPVDQDGGARMDR
jgi:hypothetical protein